MDTNVIIAIVAVVVIAAILVIGGWWLGKTRKNAVDKSTEDAKAKADARLAAEAKSAAADSSTVKPSVDSNVDAAEKAPAESQQKSSAQASSSETAAPAPATEAKPEPVHETPESAGTRMQRLKARLSKSGNPFGKALFNILAKDQLSEADWEDVEDTLLLADVGAEASEQLVEELRNDARIAGQSDPAEVRAALKDKLLKLVGTDTDRRLNANKEDANKPSVIIMVGVNGTGKTTTAGKLSRLLVSEGKQVMLGAADTFRAAAAARKVSAAPNMTCLPSETSRRESLPAVVVLPVPFTPTMMMTLGLFASSLLALRRRSVSVPTSFNSLSFSAARTSAGSDWPAIRASLRSSSTSCSLASAPTSASRRVSSTSSQSASES